MSRQEKLLASFMVARRDYKWLDLVAVLKSLGFEYIEAESSRVDFIRGELTIHLHKPHPQKEVKAYALRQVKELLTREGLI